MPTPAPDIAQKMAATLTAWDVPSYFAAQMLAGSWQQVYRMATGKRKCDPMTPELQAEVLRLLGERETLAR